MKKSLLSAIVLLIAWAVSASAVTTPLSAIMRLEAVVCKYEYTGEPVLEAWDYSTSYSYDRNANITSLSRQGIVDRTILGNNVFGLHSRYSMKYAVNRLSSMEIEREGEDYEGRTGVSATGKISDFWYDANGNLGRDMSRGILSTNYNRLDLPTDVYFENGHRQTIEYDGFGQKRSVSYSQTSDPILGSMMGVPEDSAYTLQGRRDYIGPHVFVGDSLEYSAFPGGYFSPEGVFYYITDWQGNNIAVFSDCGKLIQQTTYYHPYGEPTIEPTGQRYLFGGKEREHAGGRNSYDFVARNLGPSGNWDSADRKSESFYPFSPFSYCGGDPINRIDRDGKFWETVWDVGNILWDAGCAIKAHIDGDHQKANEYWKDAAYDTGAALLPFVPAGASKGAKLLRGTEKGAETAVEVSPKMKNADKIQEGIDWGHTVKKEFEDLGYQVADEVSVVPLNGKGNIKGNRSRVDLLIRDTDGKFIIIESKLTNKTKPSSGQTSVMNHIGTSGGKVEIRSDLDKFGLKKGQTIEVKEYIRINKYD